VIPNAHGKTGTTQNDVDAWFMGFTPDVVTGVWAGNDGRVPMNHAFGGSVCGPVWVDFMRTATRVQKEVKARQGRQVRSRNPDPFKEEPRHTRVPNNSRRDNDQNDDSIVREVICDESGMLANEYCPSTHVETFTRGEEPTKKCNVHGISSNSSGNTEPSTPEVTPNHTEPRTEPRSEPKQDRNQETIELSICTTSHKIANEFCPRTVTKRFSVDRAPQEVCDIHGPM
jgi:penicillin-binding protein 1A